MEARHFCPQCGFIDIIIENQGLKGPDGKSLATATCPNCGWAGGLNETLGGIGRGFWDAERVGNLLIGVLARSAAGPLVQALEYVGLLPKEAQPKEYAACDSKVYVDAVIEARNVVMRRILEASITAAFEEAMEQQKLFMAKVGEPDYTEEEDTFGGDA